MSLLFLPLAWVVTAAGRELAAWLRLPDSATPLERSLIGYGLGLGLLAYGILALGLLGLLYPTAGLLWVVALALLGARQHTFMAREARDWRPGWPIRWGWGVAGLFAAFGGVSLFGVYSPPVVFIPGVNATEWDSLSYHLADPKLFLQLHRVVSLPWQPLSNFAFTAEMWNTLALMARGSVPLAKWFSWACFAGTALGTYALGARHLTPRIGLWAALLFVSTPLAFWEAGTAYIDGATAFYATLALLCVVNGLRTPANKRWLWVGALLMGLALSTKASALAFLLVLAVGVGAGQWRAQKAPLRGLFFGVQWGVLALLAGSTWYIKSWVCTGNPVYPYFYALFGGRWWGPRWAAAYAATNNPGLGHTLNAAILLPWNLTMLLPPGHPVVHVQPFNEFPSALLALLPVLLAALFFPAFGVWETPRAVKALAAYGLAATLLWFTQTQYVRFLLPLVPVYCLLSAWALCQAVAARSLSGYALAALACGSLLWSLTVGLSLAAIQAPVALGLEARAAYLSRYDAGYGAMRYVNHNLPPGSKVAFFGYTFGFPCDRPYLWADQSAYVLTPQVNSPGTLLARLRALGVTDILVDTDTPRSGVLFAASHGPDGWLYALTGAHGPPLYPGPGNRNRGILVYALPSVTKQE